MTTRVAIAILSVLLAVGARATGDSDREVYITKIESLFFRTAFLSADSPFVSNLLGAAKSANPGVSAEVWTSVASESAIAFEAILKEKGGPMDTVFRSAFQDMSTSELEHLSVLLSDPVFQKYSAATRSMATQRQLAGALMQTTFMLNEAINKILVAHGLKEVH